MENKCRPSKKVMDTNDEFLNTFRQMLMGWGTYSTVEGDKSK